MIDPKAVTDYHRTTDELQTFVLWATTVPTKDAHRMAQANAGLLFDLGLVYGSSHTPFQLVRIALEKGMLHTYLEKHRIGQYTRIEQCWNELTFCEEKRGRVVQPRDFAGRTIVRIRDVDLRSVPRLEEVHGIGMKTARFIVLHNVQGANYAVLDTHLIKELREREYPIEVRQKVGEDGKLQEYVPLDRERYLRYETFVLEEAHKAKLTPAEYDLATWTKWNEKRRAA